MRKIVVGLCVCLLVATAGTASAGDASRAGGTSQLDAGKGAAPPPAVKERRRCGPFAPLCAAAARVVATRVVPFVASTGAKIVSRGSSAVKKTAVKASTRAGMSRAALKRVARKAYRNAVRILNSRAFRRERWRKVVAAVIRNWKVAAIWCAVGALDRLGQGTMAMVRGCVISAAGAVTRSAPRAVASSAPG